MPWKHFFGKERMRMPDVLKLPVGIESFEEIRKEGFYYIDKTELSEVE